MELIIADTLDLPGIDYLMVAKSKEPVMLCMPSPPIHILSTYAHAHYVPINPKKWQSMETLAEKIDEEGLHFSQVFIALSSTYCRFVVDLFEPRPQTYDKLYLVDSPWSLPADQAILNQLERWQLVTPTDHETLKQTLLDLIPHKFPKTLIFLHGLGQNSRAWDQVRAELPDWDSMSLDLFEAGRLPTDFSALTDLVKEALDQAEKPVVLVGLSLGAMVTLSLLDHPKVIGAVAIAGQYQFTHNRAYQLQSLLFKLIPSWFFKKQGMDKENLLTFYQSLSNFDLTEQLKACSKPVLLLCGDKDKINHKASQELVELLIHGHFELIPGSGHEMTKDQPVLLAEAIEGLLRTI